MATAVTTKSVTVVANNTTMTAGAGDVTSSGVDLSTAHESIAHIKLTNGATGPTVPGQVQTQCSYDNSNYFDFGGPLKGGTANNGVYSWNIEIPRSAKYVRFVSGSNTAQNVTLRIEVSTVSNVSIT